MSLSSAQPKTLPLLENGDCALRTAKGNRLTQAEFERRYAADPKIRKAKLIEGIVHVASPLRFTPHAQPHGYLTTWLGFYSAFTPHLSIGIEPTVRLDSENEVQPDIVLRLDEVAGGRSRVTTDGYLAGPPELVVEIAASAVTIDRGQKQQLYKRHGVREYWLWQPVEQRLEDFTWAGGADQPLCPDTQTPDTPKMVQSRVFPGLWLDVAALAQNQMPQVVAALQQGMATPEYLAFCSTLPSAAERSDGVDGT
ncbi:MAG: Uma2 family endonuclease [Cyanobacteria bacterium P01_G01_bin.54]